MSAVAGNMIVTVILVAVCFLAVRSIWKSHRNGGHCGGDCSCCSKCKGGSHHESHK